MIVGPPCKVILQEPYYSSMRKGIAQELRNLMSEGLPQFEENLNNKPEDTDDAPGLLISSGVQCHGDQGKRKWMDKLGYNTPEKSKQIELPWKITYRT